RRHHGAREDSARGVVLVTESVYPVGEHLYRFALIQGKYNAAQLIYELEDALGILLSQYEGQEETSGWATIDNLKPQLDLRSFTPLTNAQLDVVADIITQHVPVARAYRGVFGEIVMRYGLSIGRVIVEHSETKKLNAGSGFLFARRD